MPRCTTPAQPTVQPLVLLQAQSRNGVLQLSSLQLLLLRPAANFAVFAQLLQSVLRTSTIRLQAPAMPPILYPSARDRFLVVHVIPRQSPEHGVILSSTHLPRQRVRGLNGGLGGHDSGGLVQRRPA